MKNKALKKYKRGSAVACVLSVVGTCVALFYNFAFHTGKLGLYLGMVFFAVAVVLQFISQKKYVKRIKAFDLSDEEENELIRSAKRKNEFVYGVIIALFALTLPLAMCMGFFDSIYLYEWASTVKYYLICAVLLYCGLIVLKYRWKSGIGDIIETDTDKRIYHNLGIALKKSIFLLIIVGLNSYLYVTITNNMLESFASTAFNDYDSFVEYIETENPSPDDWYIYEFEFDRKINLKDSDGNVLIDCEKKNGSVMSIYYGEWTDGYLPIRVLTYDDYDRYEAASNAIYCLYIAISVAEAGIAVFAYIKKRMKKADLMIETENSSETSQKIEKTTEK
ncbi:MAG: hypothetical protein J1E05_00600 [Eubacterium sp.]|nr:hypothetical protein [Eubacterium sp.]